MTFHLFCVLCLQKKEGVGERKSKIRLELSSLALYQKRAATAAAKKKIKSPTRLLMCSLVHTHRCIYLRICGIKFMLHALWVLSFQTFAIWPDDDDVDDLRSTSLPPPSLQRSSSRPKEEFHDGNLNSECSHRASRLKFVDILGTLLLHDVISCVALPRIPRIEE